jgi:adenylosuccinate lyase
VIERYTRAAMGRIWTEESKYNCWLEVESAASTVLAEDGVIPAEAARAIAEKASFTVERIHEIEAEVKHDVIAFTTTVAESLKSQGLDAESRWLHYGLTSNDIVDTAQALQVKAASGLIRTDLVAFMTVLKRRALEFKHTPTIGRTHGIHAEPTTFGLKMLNWYAEMERNLARFDAAAEDMRVGKLSGAVGTFGHLKPEHEERICARLGLKPAPVATQVIQRDRHAAYISTLAIIGCTLDKIALEVRHLQRTEVREAQEYFSEKQKGSSAMPLRAGEGAAEQCAGGVRGCCAMARAGHFALVGGAGDFSGLDDFDRLPAGEDSEPDRPAAGLSGADEEEPGEHGRADFQRAVAAGPGRGRDDARGCVPAGAVARHARLERGSGVPRRGGAGPGHYRAAEQGEAGPDVRYRAAVGERGRDF